MTLNLITDRRKEDVEYLTSLIAKGYGGMTSAEQTAWMNTSLKGAYNYTDFNRVQAAMATLYPLFYEAGYITSFSQRADWSVNENMTVADATQYLANLARFRNAFSYFPTTPTLPTSLNNLNYQSANEIEQILVDAEILILKLIGSFAFVGDLFVGDTITYGKMPYLGAYTWSELSDIGAAGLADVFFRVGDWKQFGTEYSGTQAIAEIIAFNHDDLASGGKAPFTFHIQNLIPGTFAMNPTMTNTNGWDGSALRAYMNSTLLATYTYQDFNNQVATVLKKTNYNGALKDSSDKLFLFSQLEMLNTTDGNLAGEGTYYGLCGLNVPDVVRFQDYGLGVNREYWTRSKYTSSSDSFTGISSNGVVDVSKATSLRRLALGFCI